MGQAKIHRMYPHMPPRAQKFAIIKDQLVNNVYTARYWPIHIL